MISQVYIEERDKLLCHWIEGVRFSIEIDPDHGVPFRVLLSRSQLEVLHRNTGDALGRIDDIERLRSKVDAALASRPVVAEAATDYPVDDFLRSMAAGFEPKDL